jgi:hypothetical protein
MKSSNCIELKMQTISIIVKIIKKFPRNRAGQNCRKKNSNSTLENKSSEKRKKTSISQENKNEKTIFKMSY